MKKEKPMHPAKPAKPPHGHSSPPPPSPPPPPAQSGPIYPRCADSAWLYQEVPSDAPINDNNPALVEELISEGGVGVNDYAYSAPLYNAKSTDPTVKVIATPYAQYGILPGLQEEWLAVPFGKSVPSPGTDKEMSLYVTDTDQLYEFWGLDIINGVPQAPRGGRMDNVRSNPGAWTGNTGFGIVATGLPYACLQISVAELQAGQINHAIGLAVKRAANWDVRSWPAQRSDGYNPTGIPNLIPEGLRFRMDPTIDFDALDLHWIAKLVGKSMQRFPGIVWDRTDAQPSIRFENPLSRTALGEPDPYPQLLGGTPEYAIFKNFPWNRTLFLPKDYSQT